MSIFPKFFFTLFGNAPLPFWLRSYIARVEEDGGTIVDTGHTKEVYADVIDYDPTLIQSCDSGKAGTLYSIIPSRDLLLYQYTGAAAAYSLRQLSAGTIYVVKVRRDSDDSEQDFTASDITDGTLLSFVNTPVQQMVNPDITSSTGWTLSSFTTYNASTEAFDLVNENGLTVRQSHAIAGCTYDITLVVDSVALNGIRVYVGGTQSADITSAGTYNITITAGSSNSFIGINPIGSATCSISSFYATQTTSNGLVTTWYDQSGNTNNATQATAANQPKIVSSGTLVTENGKAALNFDATNDHLAFASGLFVNEHSIFAVVQQNNLGGAIIAISGAGGYYFRYITSSPDSLTWYIPDTTNSGLGFIGESANQELITAIKDGSNVYGYINGGYEQSRPSTGNLTSTPTAIGRYAAGNYFGGSMQEIILYASDQSANRTGIEANINDYYNIYP
jgi:hypothetical protein